MRQLHSSTFEKSPSEDRFGGVVAAPTYCGDSTSCLQVCASHGAVITMPRLHRSLAKVRPVLDRFGNTVCAHTSDFWVWRCEAKSVSKWTPLKITN
jgi:hypothetical protein